MTEAPPLSAVAGPAIIHTTEGLLGLSKPAGLDVFGPGSLADWLIAEQAALAQVGPADQPAIVHRLDRNTSGLILAATHQREYDHLRQAFSAGQVDKHYLALVEGMLGGFERIAIPLGARYRRSRRVQVDLGRTDLRSVRPAVTEVEALASAGGYSLCRVRILTGVRHQIRAHLAHLGHPVAGDGLYGASRTPAGLAGRHFLHAESIRLDVAGCPRVDWHCPLGADLEAVLAGIGLLRPTDGA